MPRAASLAEHYRAHREAFALAMELGCTPKQAERELQRRRAAAEAREAQRRLAAKQHAPLVPGIAALAAPDRTQGRDAPWMMRD